MTVNQLRGILDGVDGNLPVEILLHRPDICDNDATKVKKASVWKTSSISSASFMIECGEAFSW